MSNAEAALTWAGLAEPSAREVVREYRGAIGEDIIWPALSLERRYDLARADVCDVEAEISERDGRPMAAAHSRAMARWYRTKDPQDSQRAGALFVSMAAEDCIQRGISPMVYTHRREEIAAEVARLRGEVAP